MKTFSQRILIASLFASFALPLSSALGDPKEEQKIPTGLLQLGTGGYFSDHAVVVDKTERTLSVWQRQEDQYVRVGHFPSDMGKNTGDKEVMGDKKTPEGIYFFLEKYRGKQLDFSRYGSQAFTTDYPNYFDQRKGKSGSGIWLHAVPDSIPLTRGSRGCVVVRNNIIQEMDKYIKLTKTPILIQDHIEYTTPDLLTRVRNQTKALVEKWRSAWVSKKLDTYINTYHSEFKSMGMNRSQWEEYKRELNKKYDYIDVKFSEPVIYRNGEEMIVKILQTYSSDKYSDFGEKTLYFLDTPDGPKIIREDWHEVKSHIAQLEPPFHTGSL